MKSAKGAKGAGEANAAAIQAETAEESRRMAAASAQTSAEGRVKAAASGTKVSGSSARVLATLGEEQQARLDWLKKSGSSRAEIATLEAGYQSDIHKGQAVSSLFSGLSGAAGSIWGK